MEGTKLSCFIGAGIVSALCVIGSLAYLASGESDAGWMLIMWVAIAGIVAGLFLRERSKGSLELVGKFRKRGGTLYFNFGEHKGKSLMQVAVQDPQYAEQVIDSLIDDPRLRNVVKHGLGLSSAEEKHENAGG